MNNISTYFLSIIIPAILLGLSTNVLWNKYPILSQFIGTTSIILLAIAFILWVLYIFFYRLVPRRFANLVYAIDEANNIAMIFHPHYKRYQPPGSRLGYHETPHNAVYRVMQEELGIQQEQFTFLFNEEVLPKYGNTQITYKPYQVKIEKTNHRLGVQEHYDFVYVCRVVGNKPSLKSNLSPKWMDMEELVSLRENDIESAPWPDIIPTYQEILIKLS